MSKKRIYSKPLLEKVHLDSEINLVMTSPGPNDPGVGSENESPLMPTFVQKVFKLIVR